MTTTRLLDHIPNGTVEKVLGRTRQLCEVPAPTGGEGERAAMVSDWWHRDGVQEVDIDSAGNVRGRIRSGGSGAILIAAHIDTVFDETTPHRTEIKNQRMFGPGVGDNTVAVAGISALVSLLPPRTDSAVWILGTTGEEGLGNLSGISHVLSNPPQPVQAVIAVEGNYLGRIATRGVGSARFSVEIRAPGGHAWEDRHIPSAVEIAAELVASTAALRSSGDESTSVNVGRLWGGEAINARAERAGFDIDLRADNAAGVDRLEGGFAELFNSERPGVQVSRELLGRRPAGAIASNHPLVIAAGSVLQGIGFTPEYVAASTDANAAYERGIPAITLGITTGGGEHTRQEWIDLNPLPLGLAALAETIARYDQQTGL